MAWAHATGRPTEFEGSSFHGRYGYLRIPRPPEFASPRQLLDHAAVISFCFVMTPIADSKIGVREEMEKTLYAYLIAYHPNELEELYTSDMEIEDVN